MNTQHYLDTVEEFHRCMCYKTPTPQTPSMDTATCELRVRLIQEEWDELSDGITREDATAQLDAVCDLQYVISGAALALGFRYLYPSRVTLCGRMEGSFSAFVIWIEQFASSSFHGNIPGSNGALATLEAHLHGIIRVLGFGAVFEEAFRCVHESNMSKQWTAQQAEHASGNLGFTRNVNGLYVATRADGKVMKPPTFIAPNLAPFIERVMA